MKKGLYLIVLLLLCACGEADIQITKTTQEEVTIAPDYKDVTIPMNIAPLNFQTDLEGKTGLVISDGKTSISVHAKDGVFHIPMQSWKELLAQNAGKDITFTVCQEKNGQWEGFKPFQMHVAPEEADPYLAYRLLISCYGQWNEMGIYQRDISTYEQSPIFENKNTDHNCLNCHTFNARDPKTMLFHMRAKNAGTFMLKDGQMEKLDTKTDSTMSALVYPYWHPTGDYIAASTNITVQTWFFNHPNTLEVFDTNSDVVLYDVNKHEIFSNQCLKNDSVMESFPTFSPDGKSLYYLSTPLRKMPEDFKNWKFSLCRIDFDPATRKLGEKVDTIYNANTTGKSVSFPKISPDGKLIVFGLQEFGNFSAWHKDCDLYAYRIADGKIYPLTEANSDESESYHSWSSNNRWMVFSSRREDGLNTRLYMTYIDKDGKAHKAFLLPQDDPVKYYAELMEAYNLPEFVSGKVELSQYEVASLMKNTEAKKVTYSK